MAKTFWASCWVSRLYNQDTVEFLKKQWSISLRFNTDEELDQNVMISNQLAVEVRDYPKIMDDVSKSGYVDEKSSKWQIQRISEHGLTLYLVNYSGRSEDGENDLWEEVLYLSP